MTRKVAIALVSVAVVGALAVLAVRYVRRVDTSLTAVPDTAAGETMTIRFVKNPTTIGEFTAQDINGRPISTKDWAGKVMIVNFWATWCPPCREEIPDLIKLQEAYRDHLQVIGISADDGPEIVNKFVAEHGINYPIVMLTDELRKTFPGVFALPTSFVLDGDRRAMQKHVGLINPAVYEQETRVLASLPTNATIETVEDTGQVLLTNAAQATEIPGVDLSALPPGQKAEALKRLNAEGCTCGCQLTLAQCRVNDSSCEVSLPLASKIVEELGGT